MPVSKKRERPINFAEIAGSSKPEDVVRIKFEEHIEDARGGFKQFLELEGQHRADILKAIHTFDKTIADDKHYKYAYDAMFGLDGTEQDWHRFHKEEDFPALLLNIIVLVRLLRDLPYGTDDQFTKRVIELEKHAEEEGDGWHGSDARQTIDSDTSVGQILMDLQKYYHASDSTMLVFTALFGYLNGFKIGGGEKFNMFDGTAVTDIFPQFASHFTGRSR